MLVYLDTFSSEAYQFVKKNPILCVPEIMSLQPEEGGIETRDFRFSGLLHSVD